MAVQNPKCVTKKGKSDEEAEPCTTPFVTTHAHMAFMSIVSISSWISSFPFSAASFFLVASFTRYFCVAGVQFVATRLNLRAYIHNPMSDADEKEDIILLDDEDSAGGGGDTPSETVCFYIFIGFTV